MKWPAKRPNGFTLMEVLVAMILLASVAAVSLYSFSSAATVTQPGSGAAYNFGRGLFEQMLERVRQDQWGTASLPLSVSTPGPQALTKSLNGKTYTANYTVNSASGTALDANADGQEDFRKVKMTVTW